MARFHLIGTLHYSDGFDMEIEASSETRARNKLSDQMHEWARDGLTLDEVCFNSVEQLPDHPEPEPPPPPPVTVTADLAGMAALALLIYSRDQQDKGRPFFAAEMLHNAATLLRGIGEHDRAAEHIARADELVASGLSQTKAKETTP